MLDDALSFTVLWLSMSSEDTKRKIISDWVDIIGKLFIAGALAWGLFKEIPWIKNKVEQAEIKADSSLQLLGSIQNQLQIQIQQQAQWQAQIQGQGQKQEQQMTNLQQTELSPNIIIPPDTSRRLSKRRQAIDTLMLVECNNWYSVPGSHDAEFRIDSIITTFDTALVRVKFAGNNEYDSLMQKGDYKSFINRNFSGQEVVVDFRYFNHAPLYSHYDATVRIKHIDYGKLKE